MHYSRWQKHGSTELPEKVKAPCVVEGCDTIREWGEMCFVHKRRWDKYGHTDEIPPEPEFCTIEGCNSKRLARRLCSTHYSRFRKGQDLEAPILRPYPGGKSWTCVYESCGKVSHRGEYCYKHFYELNAPEREVESDGSGKRKCRTCGFFQTPDQFAKDKSVFDGLGTECAPCRADRSRFNLYGVTPEAFDEMRDAQDNTCGICDRSFEGVASKNIHVDHDHNCCPGKKSCGNCVRSLLCGQCNTGLGMFRDDPGLLTRAAEYLQNHTSTPGG